VEPQVLCGRPARHRDRAEVTKRGVRRRTSVECVRASRCVVQIQCRTGGDSDSSDSFCPVRRRCPSDVAVVERFRNERLAATLTRTAHRTKHRNRPTTPFPRSIRPTNQRLTVPS
jgi:hypothetical protein